MKKFLLIFNIFTILANKDIAKNTGTVPKKNEFLEIIDYVREKFLSQYELKAKDTMKVRSLENIQNLKAAGLSSKKIGGKDQKFLNKFGKKQKIYDVYEGIFNVLSSSKYILRQNKKESEYLCNINCLRDLLIVEGPLNNKDISLVNNICKIVDMTYLGKVSTALNFIIPQDFNLESKIRKTKILANYGDISELYKMYDILKDNEKIFFNLFSSKNALDRYGVIEIDI